MCKGTPEVVGVKAHSVNRMYAALIKEQMQLRHTSLRKMADEGVLKRSRRAGFFERLEAGSLTIDEFQRVLVHLEIDPIRAGLVLLCYNSASSYEDPCCETTALVAVALAARLPSELAACEGQFATIRQSLCETIAKKTSTAIAKHHMSLENRHNGGGFEHAYA